MFVKMCMRNSGQDSRCDTGKTVVLERWKQQIAAHQHSPERTRTWLRRCGLLVYRCLRTQMSAWSSMPKRQPELLQLLSTGSLPASSSSSSDQHSIRHARKQAFIVAIFWQKVPPFPWNRCVPLRESSRSTWSLSVICQRRQRKTLDNKVCRINSPEVSKLRANPFQSWR